VAPVIVAIIWARRLSSFVVDLAVFVRIISTVGAKGQATNFSLLFGYKFWRENPFLLQFIKPVSKQ